MDAATFAFMHAPRDAAHVWVFAMCNSCCHAQEKSAQVSLSALFNPIHDAAREAA